MFIDLKKTLFLLATAPLAFGACGGDDDDDGNNVADAGDVVVPDANVSVPDGTAAPAVLLALERFALAAFLSFFSRSWACK